MGDNKAKPISISLYPAQIEQLEQIQALTGHSKSDLIQQAVNVLISQFKEILDKERQAHKTQALD